jgi:hypothetical protein
MIARAQSAHYRLERLAKDPRLAERLPLEQRTHSGAAIN